MMTRFFTPILALLFAFPASANPLEGVVELEVLPGWRTESGTHMAGLQVELAPGWKTYWRAPGDGGIPPRFGWQGSENLDGVVLHWPVPEVFHQNDMRSIGYHGTIVIPIELNVSDADADARMRGQVQIGICEEICVPIVLSFDAVLPTQGSRHPSIVAALLDRPRTVQEAGVGDVTCALRPIENGLEVTASIEMPRFGRQEEVVIEAGDQQVWVSEPQTWREDGALFARSEMIHVDGGGFALDRSDMRITVLSDGQSVDIHGCDAS